MEDDAWPRDYFDVSAREEDDLLTVPGSYFRAQSTQATGVHGDVLVWVPRF